MYDQSFTKSNIMQVIKNSDYYRQANLKIERDLLVAEAFDKSKTGFVSPPDLVVTAIKKRKKTKNIYSLKRFSDRLLVRKITRNIKVVTRAKQQDRDGIIRNLKKLLAEGVAYRIYRLDIKDFYGSVDAQKVIQNLENDWRISRPTARLVKNIFDHFKAKETGLPRGLQISATLAEYSMGPFDEAVANNPYVFFYARFVDDILILSSGEEDKDNFLSFVTAHLPTGVNLNKQKEYIELVPKIQKGNVSTVSAASFNFLGYRITAYNPKTTSPDKAALKKPRPIDLDISPNKIKKIKTRLMKAFLAYLKDKDFSLLYDRIKLLTGNYYIFDRDRYTKRTAGIFYSYKYATLAPSNPQSAIADLDKFLLNSVLSGKGRISSGLQTELSKAERRKILGQTFKVGFTKKVLHHFHNKRMIEITRCWGYD